MHYVDFNSEYKPYIILSEILPMLSTQILFQ